MKKLIERINSLADENGFPFCKIKQMNDDRWWTELTEQFSFETLYIAISRSEKFGLFNFADDYFIYDSEIGEIFSFDTKEEYEDMFYKK